MKTAISIPGPLFVKGEKLAKKLKLKRSELYARALADMIRRHDPEEVTRRLNEAYGADKRASALDPLLAAHAKRSLKKVEW